MSWQTCNIVSVIGQTYAAYVSRVYLNNKSVEFHVALEQLVFRDIFNRA